MELRHLRYAIAVAEELHFGRAAERLHMSQPPLSMQIQQIEQELGVKLFERTKRSVKLTAAGQTFVTEARLILKHMDTAAKVTIRAARGELGALMVGTITSTDSGFYRVLVDILQRFAERYPDVHLGLRTLSVGQQVHDLKEDRLTVGFVTLPIDDPLLAVKNVHFEPVVLALPAKHPLAAQRRVTARALARESFIFSPRHQNPGFFDSVTGYFQKAGCSVNIIHEGDNLYTTLALVAAGIGVSLFPASLLDVPRKGVVVRKLDPAPPKLGMGVAYRRHEQSEVLQAFLKVLAEFRRGRIDTST
jgi:DNA-binding transcriptional LysR family regulator